MRSRLLFVAIGLVVGVALTSGAVWADRFRAELVSKQASGGTTKVGAVANASYTAQIDGICVDGGQKVRIDRVRPRQSYGGAKILGFALGPPSNEYPDFQRAEVDGFYAKQTGGSGLGPVVTAQCGDSLWDVRMLAVEIRAEQLPAAVDGFLIDYTVHGKHKTTRIDAFLMLCSGKEKPEDELVDGLDSDSNMGTCGEWIDD